MHLNDPDTHIFGRLLKNYANIDFLGKKLPQEVAQAIAKGEIDPMSHKVYSSMQFDKASFNNNTFIKKNTKGFNGMSATEKQINIVDNPAQF